LGDLLESGGDRDAEVMEGVFETMSFLFKFTQRKLAADLPLALQITKRLRNQRHDFVRNFTAEATAFLFRSAPDDEAVEAGIAALLEEIDAFDPTDRKEKVDAKVPIILYYTTLYYTILHYTILYYTILYYTFLFRSAPYDEAVEAGIVEVLEEIDAFNPTDRKEKVDAKVPANTLNTV
jgi:hypothetical protein